MLVRCGNMKKIFCMIAIIFAGVLSFSIPTSAAEEADSGTEWTVDAMKAADADTEWTVDVEEAGDYIIKITYRPLTDNSMDIERELWIDGQLPSLASSTIEFSRYYVDAGEITTDESGNEIKPDQVEISDWYETFAGGTSDYEDDPYVYYFEEGSHTIALTGGQGSMEVSGIELVKPEVLPSYAEYYEECKSAGITKVETGTIKIQAENTYRRSSETIYVSSDNTSPLTERTDGGESSLKYAQINVIGGENWRNAKDWIEWKVTVPEDGLYRIAFRFKQNFQDGNYSARRLYVNGVVPFEEASEICFSYGTGWQALTLNADGEECYIYLKEGENVLRLENVLGDISEIVSKLNEVVVKLNENYRRILMITGSEPDTYRDYQLDQELPEVMESFSAQYANLNELSDKLEEITGDTGTAYSRLQKTAIQLKSFVEDPDSIPERLSDFRDNISDLSSWMFDVTEQPLMLDYICLMAEDTEEIKANAGFFGSLIYEIKKFIYSFIYDNGTLASSEEEDEVTIELWMGTNGLTGAAQTSVAGASGRDQANIIKQMVAESFTPKTDINVEIKLVDMSVLLPAVASGNGPDVAINQDQTNPVNYALRGALYNLSEFEDLPEVLERFSDSAVTPFVLEGDVYALPETQTYSMMFYRRDILEELGIEPPKTWDDLYKAMTVLNRNNLEIGLPNLSDNNLDVFYMLLYQQGGAVYGENGKETALGSETAIHAFTQWSELYTKYNVSQKMDTLTRFRTGEAPIIIAPFTFYNTLSASAVEINGLWEMALLPATETEEGLDRSAVSAATGCVMFKNTDQAEASWEFLKWWTREETQSAFGRELEILYGEAGRWPTANEEAFSSLAWDKETLSTLLEQKTYVKGLEEIPGGYMTTRYIATAIRIVINNAVNPREAILDYSQQIDKEIRLKRIEFGLEY